MQRIFLCIYVQILYEFPLTFSWCTATGVTCCYWGLDAIDLTHVPSTMILTRTFKKQELPKADRRKERTIGLPRLDCHA
jgi:hypothetical protein